MKPFQGNGTKGKDGLDDYLHGTQSLLSRQIITDRIRRMGEGNVFSLLSGGTYPRYLPSAKVPIPSPCQGTYPLLCPGQDGGRGTPRYLPTTKVPTPPPVQARAMTPQRTPAKVPTPLPRYLPPIQARMGEGVSQGTYHPSQGTHPPTLRDRAASGVLDTLRSVCLSRSRRRTFL